LHAVLSYARRLGQRAAADEGDAPLLRRFAEHRDEAAFAALVGRHGPMVWSACTRLLAATPDAEDAFQATFLVLARKAGAVRRPDLLGPWLHGVAVRTAAKLRTAAARRRRKEERAAMTPSTADPTPDVVWRDLRPVLDEEVGRLPEKFRAPFVLCYLEGISNEEAARRLGCPKGTVLSRLARARERLRDRLTRRGVALPGGLLAAALAEGTASAAVPVALVETTVRLGLACAAGAGPSASIPAVALAEGVVRTMFLAKIKMAAVVLLALGLVGSGMGFLGYRPSTGGEGLAAAQEPGRVASPTKAAEKAKPPAEAAAPAATTRPLREALNAVIQFGGADDPKATLEEILGMLGDRHDVRFDINERAFKAAEAPGPILQTPVAETPLPRMNLPLAEVLRKLLQRLPVDATFVLRKHAIEITTVDALRAELRLPPNRTLLPLLYDEEVKDVPLAAALRTLSEATGVSIVLDQQSVPDKEARVSARFLNVPVDAAVRVLANMAGLSAVRLDNVLYVTTRDKAKELQAEASEGLAGPIPEEVKPPKAEKPK
jgi:RNA polymerase sigma factor (sigma-70 family)